MIENEYKMVCVEPSDPPGDQVGNGWHRYVIEQGRNKILGYQQGSIDAVTRSVEVIVERLNDRRQGRKGRVHLNMTSQSKTAGRQ